MNDLLKHFGGGEAPRSMPGGGTSGSTVHESDNGDGGDEEQDELAHTNPMRRRKPQRQTISPSHAKVHVGSSSGSEASPEPRYLEDLRTGGSYEVCVFHEAADCIISFPCNARHSRDHLSESCKPTVNRVCRTICRKLRNADEAVSNTATEFLEFPEDDILYSENVSRCLSWSSAVYSSHNKSIYAFPSTDSGKVICVDESLQLRFVGDAVSDLGVWGADPQSARKRSTMLLRQSKASVRHSDQSLSATSRYHAHDHAAQQHLFAGGCVDPQTGRIFAVPYDADRVLMIIPKEEGSLEKDVVLPIGEEVSDFLEVANAYVDAVHCLSDGNIYLIPSNGSRVLRVNLHELSSWSALAPPRLEAIGPRLRLGDAKFSCGVHGSVSNESVNGMSFCYVYCIPDEANYVYRIGPITKGCPASKVRVESIGVDPVGGDPNNENRVIEGKKYSSAVLCETGDIFCIPFKAMRVLCISAEQTSSGIKTGVDLVCELGVDMLDIEYCGAVVMDRNSSIYAVNSSATEALWVMPAMKVVEQVPQDDNMGITGTILPPVHRGHGNSAFFAVFDHNPSLVKHFPSRLSQLTVHKVNQPWQKMSDIDCLWRDIHLLVTHGGPDGNQERAQNAIYYDNILDSLFRGVDKRHGQVEFTYSLEQLLSSVLNKDNANEFYTIGYSWLAIRPFLESITRTNSVAQLESLWDDKGKGTGKKKKSNSRKQSFSYRRGSEVVVTSKPSNPRARSKKLESDNIIHDGVAACLMKALFDITDQLQLQETASDFEKEEFAKLCKTICEVLYAVFSRRPEALRHELDEVYPARNKEAFAVLLHFDYVNEFLVLSGTCNFLATSMEFYRQIAPQVTDHSPSLDKATELYLDVLVSTVGKHTRRANSLRKRGLLNSSSQLKSMFSNLLDEKAATKPSRSQPRSSTDTPEAVNATSVQQIFNMVDRDGNGRLDLSEMNYLLKNLGIESYSHANMQKAFASLDLDGNGVVDFDEFLHWYQRNVPVDKAASFLERVRSSKSLRHLNVDAEDDSEQQSAESGEFEFSISHNYSAEELVRAIQMAACNLFHVADHVRTESDEERRRVRRATFRALCCSERSNLKKLVLEPTTIWSSSYQVAAGPNTLMSAHLNVAHGTADWFYQMVQGDKKKGKDFTLLTEYFLLCSGIATTWRDIAERDQLEDCSSQLSAALARSDNLILTTLLGLDKTTRVDIAQTSLAEEMVTMSLRKPLALMMHFLDILSMFIFIPVYNTLCYHAILDKKIPAVLYGQAVAVRDSQSLTYVFVAMGLHLIREVWKICALSQHGMFRIYISDHYNIVDVLFIGGGFTVAVIMSDEESDCTLPKFRILASLVTGVLMFKLLGIFRIMSVPFASFLIALGEIFVALESFLLVFGIFVVCFGQMFVLLFEGDKYLAREHSVWVNWSEAYLAMYRMMLGDFDRDWFRLGGNDADDDTVEYGDSQLLSLVATVLFILNQFVVSIILLNVLIAIVSKAYDTSISKGRIHFLSERLNIAALYGAMGLTRENQANTNLNRVRNYLRSRIRRLFPSLYTAMATSAKNRVRNRRTATFRPDERGHEDDSDDEDAASRSRYDIKMKLGSIQSTLDETIPATLAEMMLEVKKVVRSEMGRVLREERTKMRGLGKSLENSDDDLVSLRPELRGSGLIIPSAPPSPTDSEEEEEEEDDDDDSGNGEVFEGLSSSVATQDRNATPSLLEQLAPVSRGIMNVLHPASTIDGSDRGGMDNADNGATVNAPAQMAARPSILADQISKLFNFSNESESKSGGGRQQGMLVEEHMQKVVEASLKRTDEANDNHRKGLGDTAAHQRRATTGQAAPPPSSIFKAVSQGTPLQKAGGRGRWQGRGRGRRRLQGGRGAPLNPDSSSSKAPSRAPTDTPATELPASPVDHEVSSVAPRVSPSPPGSSEPPDSGPPRAARASAASTAADAPVSRPVEPRPAAAPVGVAASTTGAVPSESRPSISSGTPASKPRTEPAKDLRITSALDSAASITAPTQASPGHSQASPSSLSSQSSTPFRSANF